MVKPKGMGGFKYDFEAVCLYIVLVKETCVIEFGFALIRYRLEKIPNKYASKYFHCYKDQAVR